MYFWLTTHKIILWKIFNFNKSSYKFKWERESGLLKNIYYVYTIVFKPESNFCVFFPMNYEIKVICIKKKKTMYSNIYLFWISSKFIVPNILVRKKKKKNGITN